MAEDDKKQYGNRQDDLEVKTPFGWSVRAGGRQMTLVVIILLCCGFLAYMVRDHDLRAAERAAGLDAKAETLAKNQTALVDSVDSLAFIMTLSDEERKKLRLGMPDALRRKTNYDNNRWSRDERPR